MKQAVTRIRDHQIDQEIQFQYKNHFLYEIAKHESTFSILQTAQHVE